MGRGRWTWGVGVWAAAGGRGDGAVTLEAPARETRADVAGAADGWSMGRGWAWEIVRGGA